ncbi:MAG: choice-of-anchor J domain-containing protein [Bacteroidales bacterium]|nr:choice-of-anchor J domain-containing protein [Bacteroidales bacterium]
MKRTIIKLAAISVLFGVASCFTSCVKQDFDEPPMYKIPIGKVLTIAEVRQIYYDSSNYTFKEDYSVYAIVTMDGSSGNIYKSAYVQDATGAINLHLKEPGGLRVGDSIRVYLKNCIVSDYSELIQIDNVQNDSNIIIIANQRYIQPKIVTIGEINTGNFEAYLIKLENVQFKQGDIGKTYADENDPANRYLEDCDGNEIIVRTSDYANFAEVLLPEGKGTLVAIVGKYYETMQLYIRTIDEVKLDGERCGGGGTGVTSIDEDFESQTNNEDIAIEGWQNVAMEGSRLWRGKEYDDNIYAQATSYGSDEDNECWLITPGINLSAMNNPEFSFVTAKAYWVHNGLSVLISTDFNGVNIASATWTDLGATITGENDPDHEWILSGVISLSSYSGTAYIAFKYVGSGLSGQTSSYRVDNVLLYDE